MVEFFSVCRRNPGHWDIGAKEHGRAFRIRGGPGNYRVIDERRPSPRENTEVDFKTVGACMTYICEELMFELDA